MGSMQVEFRVKVRCCYLSRELLDALATQRSHRQVRVHRQSYEFPRSRGQASGKRLKDLTGSPEPMQQHCELSGHGDDGALSSILTAGL